MCDMQGYSFTISHWYSLSKSPLKGIVTSWVCGDENKYSLLAALVIIACIVLVTLAFSKGISRYFAILIMLSTFDFMSDIWYALTTDFRVTPLSTAEKNSMKNVGGKNGTGHIASLGMAPLALCAMIFTFLQIFAFAWTLVPPRPRAVTHVRSRLMRLVESREIKRRKLHDGELDDGVKFILLFASHLLWAVTNPHWALLWIVFWTSAATYSLALFVVGFVFFCTKMLSISAVRRAWFAEWSGEVTVDEDDADSHGLANGHYQFAFFSELVLESIPQLIIQLLNQSQTSFTPEGIVSAVFSASTIYLHLYKYVYFVVVKRLPLREVPFEGSPLGDEQKSAKPATKERADGSKRAGLLAFGAARRTSPELDVEFAEFKSRVVSLEERVSLLEAAPKGETGGER